MLLLSPHHVSGMTLVAAFFTVADVVCWQTPQTPSSLLSCLTLLQKLEPFSPPGVACDTILTKEKQKEQPWLALTCFKEGCDAWSCGSLCDHYGWVKRRMKTLTQTSLSHHIPAFAIFSLFCYEKNKTSFSWSSILYECNRKKKKKLNWHIYTGSLKLHHTSVIQMRHWAHQGEVTLGSHRQTKTRLGLLTARI